MFRHFTLTMNTYVHFWLYLDQFFLEWEMFQTEVVEKNENEWWDWISGSLDPIGVLDVS